MAQYKSPLFLPHTGCLLAQLWWHTQERDRCELTILLQRRTCQAACHRKGHTWQGQKHFMGPAGRQQVKAVLEVFYPGCCSALRAQCSLAPGALALAMLSAAAAHPCTNSVSFPVHQPMHPQQMLTANNQRKAPVTHGCQHIPPCILCLGFTCELPGTGFAETLKSIQCILAQYK